LRNLRNIELQFGLQVLTVTGLAALVMWVFGSALMLLTEANNHDPATLKYYASVPQV
jgi:hypothetical protein